MTKEEAIKLVQSDFENVITYSQSYCQDIYLDIEAIIYVILQTIERTPGRP